MGTPTGKVAPGVHVAESFYDLVRETVRDLYIEALKDIPPDIRQALRRAYEAETGKAARFMLGNMLRAIEVGEEHRMLVCQDTGIPIYFVSWGSRLHLDGARLDRAIVEGTEEATRSHPLRSSIVSPIGRENRQTNTGHRIPIIHHEFVPGSDELKILAMPKGSGSENMSFMKMLTPAEGLDGIRRFVLEKTIEAGALPCPPTVIGVGVGGSSDLVMLLAKRATARPVGTPNADPEMATLEAELLEAVNQTGIGPQGVGGRTTALAVHVEHAWTHITTNPVAVNMQCWRAERRSAVIGPEGTVSVGY